MLRSGLLVTVNAHQMLGQGCRATGSSGRALLGQGCRATGSSGRALHSGFREAECVGSMLWLSDHVLWYGFWVAGSTSHVL